MVRLEILVMRRKFSVARFEQEVARGFFQWRV
jgi:hypothetical protein